MTNVQPPSKRVSARLTEDEYELLLGILNIQSHSRDTVVMRDAIRTLVRADGCSTQRHEGNLYVTKGVSPNGVYPCFVAHTDTVHKILPDEQYQVVYRPDGDKPPRECKHFAEDRTQTPVKPVGIGGDDKVGIFIALQMLKDLPYGKAAFFRDEEIGCLGANVADMTFFDDVGFVIQCDRRGDRDIVRRANGTELYGDEFHAAILDSIKDWGYSNVSGAMTDVRTLKEKGLKVAACNLSCGYYDPHMERTWVEPNMVAVCLGLVRDMTTALGDKVWQHVYEKPVYHQTGYQYGLRSGETWFEYRKRIDIEDAIKVAEKYTADVLGGVGLIEIMPGVWAKPDVAGRITEKAKGKKGKADKQVEMARPGQWFCVVCLSRLSRPDELCAECGHENDEAPSIDDINEMYAFYEKEGGTTDCCPYCGDFCIQYDTEAALFWCFGCDDYFGPGYERLAPEAIEVKDYEDYRCNGLTKTDDHDILALPMGDASAQPKEGEPNDPTTVRSEAVSQHLDSQGRGRRNAEPRHGRPCGHQRVVW